MRHWCRAKTKHEQPGKCEWMTEKWVRTFELLLLQYSFLGHLLSAVSHCRLPSWSIALCCWSCCCFATGVMQHWCTDDDADAADASDDVEKSERKKERTELQTQKAKQWRGRPASPREESRPSKSDSRERQICIHHQHQQCKRRRRRRRPSALLAPCLFAGCVPAGLNELAIHPVRFRVSGASERASG